MAYRKNFIIETLDAQGKLMKRFEKEIENNPEYGEVECKLVLSNDPDVRTVSIMEPAVFEDGKAKYMGDEKGNALTDGKGELRPEMIVRMRFDRTIDGQAFAETERDWKI